MKKLLHATVAGTKLTWSLIIGLVFLLSNSMAQTNLNIDLQKVSPGAKTESIEDFETGNFAQFDWQTGGTLPWVVSTTNPYEGSYCAKSGAITHNQETWLSLTYNVYAPANITFYYRVSSEPSYDFLKFYIDNVELGSWSGTVPWTQASYPVTAGVHTFKWRYNKDVSVNTGEDAAFIDYIVFPPMEIEALFTSDTTIICELDVVHFMDQSVGPITQWNWIFEGGTPGTSTEQNPVVGYTTAGSYDVLLEVTDGVETSQVYMANYVTVGAVPAICPAPTGITYLCASWGNSSYNTVGLSGITLYNWQLLPLEAGTVSGTGKNVTVVWEDDFLGTAPLKVAGVNYCGTGVYSNALTITRYLPNVTLNAFPDVSITTPPFTLTGGSPTGGIYSGTGVSNGTFSPAVAGLGTHTITYTYTDLNLCENSAQNTITVTEITGIAVNSIISEIIIYPNPGNGSFFMSIDLDKATIMDIEVFNSLNEVVYDSKNILADQKLTHNLDLNHCPSGIYYVHITSPDNQWIKKVIITK